MFSRIITGLPIIPDAAYYMQKNCPWAKCAILEGRYNLGGTWDLFKYPGNLHF